MDTINYSKLGINIDTDIPINLLFDSRYNHDMDEESRERISIIREIIEEYNQSQPLKRDDKVSDSKSAAKAFGSIFRGANHEELWALFLDGGNTPIKRTMLGKGGISAVAIDSTLIAKESIRHGAAKVIIAHSHPSGNPAPSHADLVQTEALKKKLDLFDIKLCDHLIFSTNGDMYYSFADEKCTSLKTKTKKS